MHRIVSFDHVFHSDVSILFPRLYSRPESQRGNACHPYRNYRLFSPSTHHTSSHHTSSHHTSSHHTGASQGPDRHRPGTADQAIGPRRAIPPGDPDVSILSILQFGYMFTSRVDVGCDSCCSCVPQFLARRKRPKRLWNRSIP